MNYLRAIILLGVLLLFAVSLPLPSPDHNASVTNVAGAFSIWGVQPSNPAPSGIVPTAQGNYGNGTVSYQAPYGSATMDSSIASQTLTSNATSSNSQTTSPSLDAPHSNSSISSALTVDGSRPLSDYVTYIPSSSISNSIADFLSGLLSGTPANAPSSNPSQILLELIYSPPYNTPAPSISARQPQVPAYAIPTPQQVNFVPLSGLSAGISADTSISRATTPAFETDYTGSNSLARETTFATQEDISAAEYEYVRDVIRTLKQGMRVTDMQYASAKAIATRNVEKARKLLDTRTPLQRLADWLGLYSPQMLAYQGVQAVLNELASSEGFVEITSTSFILLQTTTADTAQDVQPTITEDAVHSPVSTIIVSTGNLVPPAEFHLDTGAASKGSWLDFLWFLWQRVASIVLSIF